METNDLAATTAYALKLLSFRAQAKKSVRIYSHRLRMCHSPLPDKGYRYLLCRDDPGNAEWYRLEALESCPVLTELWPQPFQAKFAAADGAVLIRFRSGPDGGIRVAANVVDS